MMCILKRLHEQGGLEEQQQHRPDGGSSCSSSEVGSEDRSEAGSEDEEGPAAAAAAGLDKWLAQSPEFQQLLQRVSSSHAVVSNMCMQPAAGSLLQHPCILRCVTCGTWSHVASAQVNRTHATAIHALQQQSAAAAHPTLHISQPCCVPPPTILSRLAPGAAAVHLEAAYSASSAAITHTPYLVFAACRLLRCRLLQRAMHLR